MKQLFFLFLTLSLSYLYSQNRPHIDMNKETQVTIDSIGGKLKTEPSVVIDDDIIIVSWNDSYGGQTGTDYGVCVGWAISYDTGATFDFGGYLSKLDNDSYGGADSWLAKDNEGNFYLQVLSFNKALNLYFMERTNLGHWIRLPDPVTSKTVDKPFLHIANDNSLWISYSDNQSIYVISSKNRGKRWSNPILVSNNNPKSRGGSSITSYEDKILVAWAENEEGNFFDELWYNEISNRTQVEPKLIFKQKGVQRTQTPGYSMGIDHEGTKGRIITPNLTWINSINSELHPISVTFGTKSKDVNKILLFDFDLKNSSWKKPMDVGDVTYSPVRIFASNSNIKDLPAVLYYDRRHCSIENCTITDVYLSILVNSKWVDYKINDESTDWNEVVGDKTYAPIQRNFGDYITLANDDNKAVAVWTDGRNKTSQIYIRVIKLK